MEISILLERISTSLLLLEQIAKMFLMIFMGYILVKAKLLKAEDSKVMSVVVLYVVTPCVIINAFQIERTGKTTQGLLFTLAVAILLMAMLMVLSMGIRKALNLKPVEQASIMYSNAGNMILPIISSMFGTEWVIYSCVYMSLQTVLFWTHLWTLLSGEKKMNWGKALVNVNVLATFAGVLLYAFNLHIPGPVNEALSSVGALIGPMSMFITGMLIAAVDLKKILRMGKAYFIVFLRLIGAPLCTLPVLYLISRMFHFENQRTILMIVFLATTSPVASTVVQMSQICGEDQKEAEYGNALNILTVLFCIITMPVMIGIFGAVIR